MWKLIGVALIATILTQSCTQSCNCAKDCKLFNNDSIKVCSANYASYTAYMYACDSMDNLYGYTYRDSIIDEVKFSGTGNKAFESKRSNLESEGYLCNCYK